MSLNRLRKLRDQINARKPIPDRDVLTDMICDVMIEGWRSTTIDALLLHPHEAIRMAAEVDRRRQRPNSRANITAVLRAALAARKRGVLKLDRA